MFEVKTKEYDGTRLLESKPVELHSSSCGCYKCTGKYLYTYGKLNGYCSSILYIPEHLWKELGCPETTEEFYKKQEDLVEKKSLEGTITYNGGSTRLATGTVSKTVECKSFGGSTPSPTAR